MNRGLDLRPIAIGAAEQLQLAEHEQSDVQAKDPRVWVELTLRTEHAEYLEYIAERDSLLLSHALEYVVAEVAQAVRIPARPKPSRKERRHVSIGQSSHDFINQLAALWGIPRSGAARRLIELAMARDGRV